VAGVCQEGKTASEQSSDHLSAHEREGEQKHNPELIAILVAKIVMGPMSMRMLRVRMLSMFMTVPITRRMPVTFMR
jgi:hypothetical protein